MNQMRTGTYAPQQIRLQDAAVSLRMAANALQQSQKELLSSYQSTESSSLQTLIQQYIQELRALQRSCEALRRQWLSTVGLP